MSIRTNPMNAIPLLLKRLKMTRSRMATDKSFDAKMQNLIFELDMIKDLFSVLRRNEEELLDTLTLVDGHLRNLDKTKLNKVDMENICRRIRDSTQKLLPMSTNQGGTSRVEKSSEEVHSVPSSSQHEFLNYQDLNLILSKLENQTKDCFNSLSIFPEGAVIKKRHTIYWWIGEGFVRNTEEKTAEEVGEDVIYELLHSNLILPHGNAKCPVVNKFKIHPRFHPDPLELLKKKLPEYLLVLEQKKFTLGDDDHLVHDAWKTIFNVGVSYLYFRPQWLAKMKILAVLQLGRWQDSPSHHIEVGSEEFLKELKDQKKLKYLSLRGISRISNLPPSITQLGSLEILDLKACHNLETLPDDIASLKRLTHLDVSQCYLLESMPKGIEKLTQLQVLKGFVIGSSRKTPCGIQDLAKLKALKRLSIHIGSEAVIPDTGFESLASLSAVKCLKISWGVSNTRYIDIPFNFPPRLEKLDLEGFPGETIPEWLKPSKLPDGLKKLYIKGGKLKTLDHGEICHKWRAEIVRLKYLNHLQIEDWKLHKLFPSLRYVQKIRVLNRPDSEWKMEE